MHKKAHVFFFGIIFVSFFGMFFSLVRQATDPRFKQGLNDWAKISTQHMR